MDESQGKYQKKKKLNEQYSFIMGKGTAERSQSNLKIRKRNITFEVEA
ncbi:MAG: hypothetical protein ACMG6E_04465 [Candidatus Roizmanbacteria bacterium]